MNYSFFADQGETPETLAERRLRANILASQIGGGTDSIGNGIGDVFRGLGVGLSRYRADSAERSGNATARSDMDELASMELARILSQPRARPLSTPNNDTVRSGLKTGLATGKVPQLAVYTPPGPQNAGMVDSRPRPYMAPQQAPVAEMEEEPAIEEGAMPEPMPGVEQADYAPAPMQPANADAALIKAMLKVLRNPYTDAPTRAFVQQQYDDIAKKMDPDYRYEQQTKRTKDKMEIGKMEIELLKLKNPDKKFQHWDDGKGNLWVYDPSDPAGTKKKIVSADEAGAPKGDQKDAVPIANALRLQPATQALAQQLPMLKSMYRALGKGGSVNDLDFIYGIAKTLDPIGSVRDADAANVIGSMGAGRALLGEVRKAISGEAALSPATRLQLYELAQRRTEESYNAAMEERATVQRQLELGNYDLGNLPAKPTMPMWREQANPTPGEFVGPDERALASRDGRDVRIPKVRIWNPATGQFQ